MNDPDLLAFSDLLRETHLKCFGAPLEKQLSESESRHLSNDIEEKTGLVIGWKSVKNYVAFVLPDPPGKRENPSVATLDTLARYVLGAPLTTEIQRKRIEAHYPYWFRYKDPYKDKTGRAAPFTLRPAKRKLWLPATIILGLTLVFYYYLNTSKPLRFAEDFHSVQEDYLKNQGWVLLAGEENYWQKRAGQPGKLTLFTLQGDNWPKTGETPLIRNLLVRKIEGDCFSTEVQFSDFMPTENWQQAGLLLLEDTTYAGKSIRLSLSYNDFFGGYTKPGEIIIQAIASYGKGYSNLEEIVHQPLFALGQPDENNVVARNLRCSAVRIEKQGHTFRFLYAASPAENFSFKELAVYDFDMTPKFVGVFALKGFVDSTEVIPVGVSFFRLERVSCIPIK